MFQKIFFWLDIYHVVELSTNQFRNRCKCCEDSQVKNYLARMENNYNQNIYGPIVINQEINIVKELSVL